MRWVIAVNTATFIGYNRKGIAGGIAATLGVITPSVVIILVIAAFIQNFIHIPWVQHAFAGVRVAVAVLILNTIIKMWKNSIKGMVGIAIFAGILAASIVLDASAVLLLVCVIAGALLVEAFRQKREGGQ